jgi:hypothetical protein
MSQCDTEATELTACRAAQISPEINWMNSHKHISQLDDKWLNLETSTINKYDDSRGNNNIQNELYF